MVRGKITTAQFFGMMFVCRAVALLGLSSGVLGGENFFEAAVSYAMAATLGLLLAEPALRLHRAQADAESAAVPLGRVGACFYLLYFVCINAASLALFCLFLRVSSQEISALAAMAAVLAAAVFGAWRGIETVARTATCVAAILLACCCLIFALVLPRFSVDNLPPLFSQGVGQVCSGVWLFIARTSVFADFALLLPFVKGDHRRGFYGWTVGSTVFACVLLVLVQGCLGEYATVQEFPVYVLSSATEVRSLERMDILFFGIWLMGLVIRAACDLCACRVCLHSFSKRERPWFVLLPAVAMLTLAGLLASTVSGRVQLQNTPVLLVLTLLGGTVLPILALLKSRRGERENQHEKK